MCIQTGQHVQRSLYSLTIAFMPFIFNIFWIFNNQIINMWLIPGVATNKQIITYIKAASLPLSKSRMEILYIMPIQLLTCNAMTC